MRHSGWLGAFSLVHTIVFFKNSHKPPSSLVRSGMASHASEHFCSISFIYLFIYLTPLPPPPLESTSSHHASCSRCWILDSGIKSPLASPEETTASCGVYVVIVLDRSDYPAVPQLYFLPLLTLRRLSERFTEWWGIAEVTALTFFHKFCYRN